MNMKENLLKPTVSLNYFTFNRKGWGSLKLLTIKLKLKLKLNQPEYSDNL